MEDAADGEIVDGLHGADGVGDGVDAQSALETVDQNRRLSRCLPAAVGTHRDAETLGGLESIAERVRESGKMFSAVIAASFGCPFEGEVSTDAVVNIAQRLDEMGVNEILLADTIGCAVPSQVRERLTAIGAAVGSSVATGCHFHNTRNTGIANAVAAVESGVRILDASVGGIGGCPFAPRATGNISTEDLCYVLRNMDYATGVDLAALIDVANWVEGYFDDPLPGQLMKAGIFPDDVIARQAAR